MMADNTVIAETVGDAVDVTTEQDGGVMKQVLKAGNDERPMAGDTVTLHYVGTLESDGSVFDSSRERGDYFEFQLGQGSVIKGWELGVATMTKGELSKFTIRSDYAYGDAGSMPKIPGGATLIFEVELFSWKGEDLTVSKDGGITRTILQKGEGFSSPNDGAWIKIVISGKCKGTVFDEERTVEFVIGEGLEKNIPDGIEKALEKFNKNEKSIITLQPEYAFGESGNSELGVPADTTVEYTVELLDFEKVQEVWEMGQDEKIDQAKITKEKGTNYFKDGKYKLAIKQYIKVRDLVSYDSGLSEEKKKECFNLKLAAELNLAMCYLKEQKYIEAKEHSTNSINEDPESVKGYFRRGQANQYLKDYEAAMADYKMAIKIDQGNNTAAKKQLNVCMQLVKEQAAKDKALYRGMFDKFAAADINKAAAARKTGALKAGVGEWDEGPKEEEAEAEAAGDLSDVQLISSDQEIKGDEFMSVG